jgi:VWFA-related protein
MIYQLRLAVIFFGSLVFTTLLSAQGLPPAPGLTSSPDGFNTVGPPGGTAPFDLSGVGMMQLNTMVWDRQGQESPLLNPALSVSNLDRMAPKKARQEFEKGLQLMYRKDYQQAMPYFSQAIAIYPSFVAAHDALGSSLLSIGRNQEARDEFATAAVLDSRLPVPYMNLGYAELALKHYTSARLAAEKAASIAPLDFSVLSLLAYSQLMSRDYAASIATADRVHSHKDRGHAIIHFYAAAAWDGEGHHEEEESHELEILIKEAPKSKAAEQAKDLLQHIRQDKSNWNNANASASEAQPSTQMSDTERRVEAQISKQNARQEQQIAEAESMCDSCETGRQLNNLSAEVRQRSLKGWTLHSDVDEVAVFFVATDQGKPVGDLIKSEVTVRDAGRPPSSVVAFRREDQLPLRLGLVIDESQSVSNRFKFEQAAASDFVRKSLTNQNDLAFLVGVSNSVLLVQDFTSDSTQLSQAISSLSPAGGTALWDAISFAADKLSKGSDAQPVAKVLVVISDGQDNASSSTLKQAIEAAERADVTVYTVSTNDIRFAATDFLDATVLGDRALKNLAERSGGKSFIPGSLSNLDHSLAELQNYLHARYALSYKPAPLKGDGSYREIRITAKKSGRKLRVYARKGYYARASLPQNSTP